MPTVHFQVTTDLPPDRILRALTDFSDQRPTVWPKIDHAHFRVHGQGPDWADVTEGNALESDTWAPGSQWRYRLQPTATGGTQLQVTVVRNGRGARGMVIGALITCLGSRILRSDMEKVLARIR